MVDFESQDSASKLLASKSLSLDQPSIELEQKDLDEEEYQTLVRATAAQTYMLEGTLYNTPNHPLQAVNGSNHRTADKKNTASTKHFGPKMNKAAGVIACCGRQSNGTEFNFRLDQPKDCSLDIRRSFYLGQMYRVAENVAPTCENSIVFTKKRGPETTTTSSTECSQHN